MGLLISFEGIDGCGKSTQINLLSEKLNMKNINNFVFREPGDTLLSDKVRNILLDKSNDFCSESEMLLFLSARSQLVREKIIPNYTKNNVILLDRFIDSTLAYQGYGRNLDKDVINKLNQFATNELTPDLTFVFHIDPKVCIDRINKKNMDRMESSGYDFIEKVSKGYLDIVLKNPDRCKVIDCTDKDILTVHNEIIDIYNIYCGKEQSL